MVPQFSVKKKVLLRLGKLSFAHSLPVHNVTIVDVRWNWWHLAGSRAGAVLGETGLDRGSANVQ